MTAKEFYTYLYKLLEKVTPLTVDCGGLCEGACCEGDGESGMYLFPCEEVMYDGSEEWLEICDSEFIFRDKPVKIAICNGTCDRKKRPLSCRIFPLFEDENGEVVQDKRAKGLCPLVTAKIPFDEYNPEFIKRVKKVFKILDSNEITREYMEATKDLINDYDELEDIFK